MGATDLLAKLNDQQAQAVQTTTGPLLIMAGAGSGKTRVLTRRIAYLIEEQHVLPWHILAITFTNKAAAEMKERIGTLLQDSGADVWASTFHALCVRILRREAETLGFSRSFSITSSSEQRTLVKNILQSQNIDPKRYDPRSVLSAISGAKNNLQTPEEYAKQAAGPFQEIVARVYTAYQAQLRVNQAFDFDDLIMQTYLLLQKNPEILAKYQEKFQYIHVDEYQDTNEAQYQLVKLLAAKYRNLCVVGDADQSIYGWRGANMENIMHFEDDYPEAVVIKLEQNYRSTKTILQAANAVIRNNSNRQEKQLWTQNKTGEKIHYYRAQNAHDEAYYVIKQIQREQRAGRSYGDFAVLYRTNAQSRVMEEALIKASVPYKVVGGHKFYDRKEIQDVLAYLRLAANPDDSLSFERVINTPKRGVGKTSVDKLKDYAAMHNLSLFAAARNVALTTITGKAQRAIGEFYKLIEHFNQQAQELNITDMTKAIVAESGYRDSLTATPSLENQTRLENIDEFLSVTQSFDASWQPEAEDSDPFVDFLADLALVSDQDDVEEEPNEVTLMTLHAAKGLEFPVVFMIGMEDNIFPLSRAMFDENELEEERRLAYVGITRAQQELFITNALQRQLYGRTQANPPSRFVQEISPDLLASDNEGITPQMKPTVRKVPFGRRRNYHQPQQKVVQPQTTGAQKHSWQVGQKVTHAKWGEGTIVKVNGSGENLELDVAFANQGIKRLLAAFAPIKPAN